MALREAHFHEARNVSDPEVLAEIASRFGFEHSLAKRLVQDPVELEETRTAAAKVATAGIRSVPHFVFSGRMSINGGQSEEALAAAIAGASAVN
jgi:predicted DsbA family dithiol-disulfide isomerase